MFIPLLRFGDAGTLAGGFGCVRRQGGRLAACGDRFEVPDRDSFQNGTPLKIHTDSENLQHLESGWVGWRALKFKPQELRDILIMEILAGS